MPPRINNNEPQRRINTSGNEVIKPKPTIEPPPKETKGLMTRRADLQNYGQQQRDRIERLYSAGVGGMSALNDVRLAKATAKADNAFNQTFNKELAAYQDYAARQKAGLDVSDYKGAKSYIGITNRAENAYRAELRNSGFKPADARGASVVKAADFLNSEAKRGGGLTTLSADRIRLRVRNGDAPDYVVRLVKNEHLSSPDATLAYFKKQNAWVATADELAGAKKDLFEVMRRIGYEQKDIDAVRADIKGKRASASDWSLAVIETNGTKGRATPDWNTVIGKAKTNGEFSGFDFSKSDFVEKVKNFQYDGMDYNAHQAKMGETPVNEYAAKFPPKEADAFRARFQIEDVYGANPLFTGDGTTLRPDAQNNKVGAREWFVDNIPLKDQQRATFVQLQDLGLGEKPTVESRPKIRSVAENPLRLGGEMRGGAKAGGAFSAVMSLREVYDQTQRGDYTGAAQTFAVNTGGGATLGGLSAGGERIVGRGIENALSRSNLANQGLERLYTNGAARNVVGRLAQTEASTLTSQTFNTTLRTVAGRVGGAGVIGGVVNGAFSSYDQIGAYRRGEVTGSQAFGTIVGETTVGVGAGMTGAAAGAAVGVWFGGVGAVPGAIIGFGVGMAAGYVSDKVLRGAGVDKAIAKGVTATIDAGSRFIGTVQKRGGQAVQAGRQYVGRQITQARAVYRSASSAVKSARVFVGQKLNNVGQRISTATRAAVNYVSQVKNRAVQVVRNTASQAVNQVRSTVSNVANRVSSTVSNIANQASSTVSNAVNNVAGGAVNTLKSVFGF